MESSPDKKPWHYILLWIIVSALAVFIYLSYSKNKPAENGHAVMMIWTPSDTVRYSPAYHSLHEILFKQAGGWTRTKVNGAWKDTANGANTVYAEDGFLYVISLFDKDRTSVETLKKEIDALIKQPENKQGFAQIASYIELLRTSE